MVINMEKRPIIGITMGDPASIGPEITIKALSRMKVYDTCRPLVIGDANVIQFYLDSYDKNERKVNCIERPEDGRYTYGTIDMIDMKLVDLKKLAIGKVSKMAGNAAYEYVRKVIELAMEGSIDATVTNALNKEAINLAGHHFSGHTEIYAHFTDTKRYTMMLVHHNLRVVHVSTHVSLREACDRVKKDRVSEVIQIAHQACVNMGIESPKIGVAGLNPHCGENGLFGREEMEEITPAIEEAVMSGVQVEGPIPPDTVFSKARGGMYDIVVAMYHDQGHIPLKVIGFVYNQTVQRWDAVEGVNITLGLPIIRTSVDHGTAFDQAGHGKASDLSLVNAIEYAINFALNDSRIIDIENTKEVNL